MFSIRLATALGYTQGMTDDRATTLGDMPRLTSAERIERLLADAIDKARAAIEDDLDRQDYDAAWSGAQKLHERLDRIEADRLRVHVILRTAEDDERSFTYVAKRFGISRSRVSQLMEAVEGKAGA